MEKKNKKVKLEIYVSIDTKEEMELLYGGLCGVVTQDSRGRVSVEVSRSVYWESVIREHLASQEELLRIFRMKRDGHFMKEEYSGGE